MRIHGLDIFQCGIFQTHQSMIHLNDLFTHDAVMVFHQKIINISNDTGSRILDWQYRVIRISVFDRFHGIPPGFHIVIFNGFPEKAMHRSKTVCSFDTLKYYFGLLHRQRRNFPERNLFCFAFFCQYPVLQFPAHRHHLPEQLVDTYTVKGVGCILFQCIQFFFFPLWIQYCFIVGNLIFRHLCTQLHPFFKKFYDFFINTINLISDLE